jgi:hypothetical protein
MRRPFVMVGAGRPSTIYLICIGKDMDGGAKPRHDDEAADTPRPRKRERSARSAG